MRVPIEIDGASVDASVRLGPGGAEVLAIGEAAPLFPPGAETVRERHSAFVLYGGLQLKVSVPDQLARKSGDAAAGGEVKAPMPGRIAAVAVAPGERVAHGGLLFTLEAMKMEHSVTAPFAGIVREVRASAGGQVEQGAVIVVLEPGEDAAGK